MMCVLWGMPYLFIKIAVEQLSPVELVFLRTGIAAALLVPYAAARGQLRPALRHWRPLLAFMALELTIPWLLLADAERDLPSSLTGLLVAAVPLVAALAGRLSGAQDRLDRSRVLGLAVGIVGVAALVGIDVRGGDVRGAALVAVVVVCYATAPLIISRWLAQVPSTGVIALSLLVTSLLYAPVAVPGLVADNEGATGGRTVLAVLVLALACTVAGLLGFFALIAEVGPQRALVITFVNPVVALLLGVAVLGEQLTLGALVGFPLVLLGCVLATRQSRPRGGGRTAAPHALAAEPLARA